MTYLTFTAPDLRPLLQEFWIETVDLQKVLLLLKKETTHLIDFETGYQRWAFEKITGLQVDELRTMTIESFKSWRVRKKDIIIFAKMLVPAKIYTRDEYNDPKSGQFNPPLPVIEWQTMIRI